jgi:crossover junction endodeoxyribonuclease RusA
VRIVVFGTPAPQGSKKFVGHAKSTGRAIMVESSKKVAPWRRDVSDAARAARNGAATLDGPLVCRMVFTMPKPASAPKKRQTWPDKKPDVSKLVRSTEDALVAAGVISDDARIVEYTRVAKVFPGEDPEALEATGCVIVIEQLAAQQPVKPAAQRTANLFPTTPAPARDPF